MQQSRKDRPAAPMKFQHLVHRARNYVPIIDVVARYRRKNLSHDIIAGLVLGVITVPQALAYGVLAGLPAQAGLYASLVPTLLYTILGSSRQLSVGPAAMISIMVAEAARVQAAPQSDAYFGVTAVICFEAGAMLWLLRVTQMSGIVNLLSHPVIAGFVNAAAILIILSQLTAFTGISANDGSPLTQVSHLARDWAQFNPATLAIGCGSLVLLWATHRYGFYLVLPFLRRVGRNHPITATGPMIVAIVTIAAVALFGLDHRYGVAVVGTIPAGLPALTWPPFDMRVWIDLVPAAAMIALVTYVTSYSIGARLASKKNHRLDANQELIALGAADVACAFTGAVPIAGSFSRSSVNVTAGARTSLSSLFSVAFIAATLLWLTPVFALLPTAALAAIIIMSISDFIDFAPIYRHWAFYRHDSVTHVVTLAGVLLFGVERGLLAGILVAIALLVRQSSKPHIAVIGRLGDTPHFRSVRRYETTTHPNVTAVRIDENLYFANALIIENRLLRILERNPSTRHLLIACSAINFIDTSGLEMLKRINRDLIRKDVRLHLADVKGPVMDQLRASDFADVMSGEIFFTTDQAMRDLAERS
jgi:SulP family sulfate permease